MSADPCIVACLAWYDEPAESLYRAVASAAKVAEAIVAIDGPWGGYPAATPRSDDAQTEAIEQAAEDKGLGLHIVTGRYWLTQVEKRCHLMREADCTYSPDWLFVIDGDEEITHCDWDYTALLLNTTERDVATVQMRLTDVTGIVRPIRRIYRASAGITVHNAHNGYRTRDGRWLHGNPTHVTLEPAAATTIAMLHHLDARPDERRQAARDYRRARRDGEIERWPTASISATL